MMRLRQCVALAGGIAGTIGLTKQKTDALVGWWRPSRWYQPQRRGIALLSRDPVRSLGGLGLLGINVGLIVVTGMVALLVMRPGQHE